MKLKCHAELFLSILLHFFSIVTNLSSATDSIFAGQSLTFNNSLISKGGTFKLGFFSPGNSSKYYIGIWYNQISLRNRTYVWVANRNTPVSDPSSELKLLDDGNLVLVDSSDHRIWSTNTTSKAVTSSQVVLRDDGNLVLRKGVRESDVYWQSFDYPTDTWLPGGRVGYDNRRLTCWTSSDDPAEGSYSVELDHIGEQYLFKWNNTKAYWNSGQWNGHIFSKNPELGLNYIRNVSYENNVSETYFTYNVYESITTRFMIDMWGQGGQYSWDATTQKWLQLWSEPGQQCEVYAFCGAYGICTENSLPVCKCMEGFEPQSPESWYQSHGYSSGCVRKTLTQCEDQSTFLMVANVTLPSNPQSSTLEQTECRLTCLNNCSCIAYAYVSASFKWYGDLLNANQKKGVGNLYLKLAASELKDFGIKKRGTKIGVIVGAVAIALSLCLLVIYFASKKKLNRKATGDKSKDKDPELPLIDFLTIETSTNKFTISNKIGEGGFGPVYKGVLPTGGEIAVKRLSKYSRQGLNEFMNEVVLIAKLQHRNLVRLLGCCIHGDERMLIYEYMPNKSLDFFIFDKDRSINLNWEKRFEITMGIARGLLYLHRDSRLRIIHRDLKAANILLDGQMNPKISDFGMARAFGGDQTEENTRRVVGTYGYMSPEYATDGLFSMKSDVFSFGVLVLEIVSGTRNRGFRHANHDFNLLGHAWNKLIDKKALELVDQSIEKPFSESEVVKCIHVGLLCVQKFPDDRPTMSTVLLMLNSDGANLRQPKQPGFYTERSLKVGLPVSENVSCSKNDVTITLLEGR